MTTRYDTSDNDDQDESYLLQTVRSNVTSCNNDDDNDFQELLERLRRTPVNADESMEFNLHHAIKNMAPMDTILRIIRRCPGTVRISDANGVLPLHLACYYDETGSTIAVLLNTYPEALHERDPNNGNTPLHCACCCTTRCDVYVQISIIQSLVVLDPTLTKERNNDQNYPLHLACRYNQPYTVIRLLLEVYPFAIGIKNNAELCPLDIAADTTHCCTLEAVINLLRTAYAYSMVDPTYEITNNNLIVLREKISTIPKTDIDDAVEIDNNNNNNNINNEDKSLLYCYDYTRQRMANGYSFYNAIDNNDDSDSNSNCNTDENNTNNNNNDDESIILYLHSAIQNNAHPVQEIIQIIQRNPDIVRIPDDSGVLPLHLACRYDETGSLIQYLLTTIFPEAVNYRDNYENNPLHHVCSCTNRCDIRTQLMIVQTLIQRNPTLAMEQNINKEYPLHLACIYYQPHYVIRFLLDLYPMAAQTRNAGGAYPLYLALTYCKSETVIDLLVSAYPMAVDLPFRILVDHDDLLPETDPALPNNTSITTTTTNTCYSIQEEYLDYWLFILFRRYGHNSIADLVQSYLVEPNWEDYVFRYNQDRVHNNNDICTGENEYAFNLACDYNHSEVVGSLILSTMRSREAIIASTKKQIITEFTKGQPDLYRISMMISYNSDLQEHPLDDMGNTILHCFCSKGTGYLEAELVLKYILRTCNKLISKRNFHYNYPLHLACLHNHSESVTQLLVEAYPLAVRRTNLEGAYPLHLACQYNQHTAVIQLLAEKYPDAVRYKCDTNFSQWRSQMMQDEIDILDIPVFKTFPLHRLCYNKLIRLSLIEFIINIDEYTSSVHLQDDSGRLPLHWACAAYRDEPIIECLIKSFPDAIKQTDSGGFCPLHISCQIGHYEAINILIDNCDAATTDVAITTRNNAGNYPLHYAYESELPKSLIDLLSKVNSSFALVEYPLHKTIQANAPENVVETIIEQYPLSTQQRDTKGFTPLHLACKGPYKLSTIKILFNAYPTSIDIKDTDGCYPLHLSCANNTSSFSIVKFLGRTSLHTFDQRTFGGCYPLHMACKGQKKLSVIKYLLKNTSRKPLNEMDRNGYYPLHFACEYQQSYEVIKFLVTEYPEAAQRYTTEDGMYPLHIACCYGQPLEVIQLLVSVYQEALFIPNKDGIYLVDLASEAEASQDVIDYLSSETTESL